MGEALSAAVPAAREELVSVHPPALLGGSCASCGQLSFPVERFCAHCGAADPRPVTLATTGTIYTFTIARFAAPGYTGPVPYAVGVVQLEPGIRVASTLIAEPLEALRIGADVTFRLLELPSDDGPIMSYAYVQEHP